ncbi:antimicrobial peptide system SdpA family protein [Curtobacterium flaccumfaciens]|nr:SdpA family antimicrobial peptide system protein [Curtobacterium flaccumfaciens]MDQ0540899.1 antimicrobial peptide system SdpA family protein [Curtobacterium flaccumfaciens]
MTARADRRPPWVFLITLVVLFLWTAVCVLESLAPSALTQHTKVAAAFRGAIVAIAPQRWEFFTASPEKPVLVAYRQDSLDSLMQLPQSKAENLFGLSRTQRAQGPELALLAPQVKTWVKCDSPGDPGACLSVARESSPQAVKNDAAHQTLCGAVVLAEVKPVPFAFRGFGYESSSITRTATLDLTCS